MRLAMCPILPRNKIGGGDHQVLHREAYIFDPAMHQSGILAGRDVKTCVKVTRKQKSGAAALVDRLQGIP
jgi:hypothetical protein